MNPSQLIYQKNKTDRNIILKARQKGFSSYILADQFVDCLKKPTNAVVISHEREATSRLLSKVKYYIDNLEVKPYLEYETKYNFTFPKTNSNYYIGTAGQKAFGRGDTLNRIHLSEVAFYKDAQSITSGVKEAAPVGNSVIEIESTANGRGNWYYQEWERAKRGESIYKPHFFPWFIDDEYSFTTEEIMGLNVSERVKQHILEPKLNDEEKNLGITIEQARWRRYKIWDLADVFWQEYPENDVDCFLQSGRPVFRVIDMVDNPGLIEGKEYWGGLDGAEGVKGGDNHCFAIINKDGIVVHELCNNDPYEEFDKQVAEICKKYSIRMGVEKNGIGLAHCTKLKELGVHFDEWDTNTRTRPMMISELEAAYRKGDLKETYMAAKNELLDMFYDDNNKAVHPENGHDDRVFARAVAWQQRKSPEPNIRKL